MAMTRLVATYRITTPLFCAGADQQREELRPTSFKGILRFWFRAMAWAELGDIKKVRAEEDVLFGSTRTGQARVILSLKHLGTSSTILKGTSLELGCGYLAGQGLSKAAKWQLNTTRPAVAYGQSFEVTLLLLPYHRSGLAAADPLMCDDILLARLKSTLKLAGLVGGMGARSRRGFGSLTLTNLAENGRDIWDVPEGPEAIESALQNLIYADKLGTELPPYTAFSSHSRLLVIPGHERESVDQFMNRIGMTFLHYRSFGAAKGNKRFVGRFPALQNFVFDHDEMLKVARGQPDKAPHRIVFGLPHNYYFRSVGPNGTKVDVNSAEWTRRASPIFFHIHQANHAPPLAVIQFLPAVFVPESQPRLKLKGQGTPEKQVPMPTGTAFWKPVHDFLDELLKNDKSSLCHKFPDAREVKR